MSKRSMPAALLAALSLVVSIAFADDAMPVPDDATLVHPLQPGTHAPAFDVKTADGKSRHFDFSRSAKPVVLIFYRGGWCPYCNTHLGQLHTAEPELLKMGYNVLFLSADKPERLYSSLKDQTIHYTLLSDASMTVARAFGIAFRVDDATVARYKTFGIDLDAASGFMHHQLPVPAVFVIDKQGVIRFTHANPDYKVRLAPEKILTAAREALQ